MSHLLTNSFLSLILYPSGTSAWNLLKIVSVSAEMELDL